MLSLSNGCMRAASIATDVEGVKGQRVSAQTIRCPLHHIGRMASSRDDAQKRPQTSRLRT